MSGFPTGVAVVTSKDARGRPQGITCSSLASVTLSPPTLLVCIRIGSPTLSALCTDGGFGVNLLHERAHHTARVFSSPISDRFGHVRWRPSRISGIPWLIDDSFAQADCRLAGTFPVGDHVIVIGQVVSIEQSADLPLLYAMRRMSAWSACEHDEPGSRGLRRA